MPNRTPTGKARLAQARKVGAELRRARRALDLTQERLAQRAKCAQATVARVELGSIPCSAVTKRIAAALLELEREIDRERDR